MDLAYTHSTMRCPFLWNADIRGFHVDGGPYEGGGLEEKPQPTTTIKQQLKKKQARKDGPGLVQ